MPKVEPPSAAAGNGHMSLEDFKSEAMVVYNAAVESGRQETAAPFNIIRRDAWPDGSAKPFKTMSMDAVPPEFRRMVLDWCQRGLMA